MFTQQPAAQASPSDAILQAALSGCPIFDGRGQPVSGVTGRMWIYSPTFSFAFTNACQNQSAGWSATRYDVAMAPGCEFAYLWFYVV
ncbi:uncharacterized protein PG986_001237 [Apiospora aurea]|uniref:Uncharacterized protein n=1 Tax=Apiospora aurea TaxID=335848 RepID=A0ABR1QXZ8_9PEZI